MISNVDMPYIQVAWGKFFYLCKARITDAYTNGGSMHSKDHSDIVIADLQYPQREIIGKVL